MLLLSEELVFFALIMEQKLRSFVLMLRLNKESSIRATRLNYVISIYIQCHPGKQRASNLSVCLLSSHPRS